MQKYSGSVFVAACKPSGFLPVAMSLSAMFLAFGVVALNGAAARQPDEGTAAHIFQLLLITQMPVIAFFAIKQFSIDSMAAASVVFLQLLAIVLAFIPVWTFRL